LAVVKTKATNHLSLVEYIGVAARPDNRGREANSVFLARAPAGEYYERERTTS